jgi:2-iminobutanoate/2-iminopropanoate deaminase
MGRIVHSRGAGIDKHRAMAEDDHRAMSRKNRQRGTTMTTTRPFCTAALLATALLAGCASSERAIHATKQIYPAIGPYSQMVQAGNTYYLSGVIPLNKEGNAIVGATIEEQTRLVLQYIGEVLKAQGMSHSNVVMSTVFMKDLNEFAKMNAVYAEFFKSAPPARATVEVARIPRDAKIEIAVIAVR